MNKHKLPLYFIFTIMFLMSSLMTFYSVGKSYTENSSLYLGEYIVVISADMFFMQFIISFAMYIFLMTLIKFTVFDK